MSKPALHEQEKWILRALSATGEQATETILSILAEIDSPRDHTSQSPLASMLFIALAATALLGWTALRHRAPELGLKATKTGTVHDPV